MYEDTLIPYNNDNVITVSQLINAVVSSAAEAELGALFINCQEDIPYRHTLVEMCHPQPPTPMQTDNTTALGVVTNIIQPKRTNMTDMCFHWLRCRKNQGQFHHFWHPGPKNKANYPTNHHANIHRCTIQPDSFIGREVMDKFRKGMKAKRTMSATRVCYTCPNEPNTGTRVVSVFGTL